MTCATCLHRSTFARRFYPNRRPLFVRCGNCKARRRARWHVAGRFALLLLMFFAMGLSWAFARRVWR